MLCENDSFDVVRDTLGLVRTEFPHIMYCVAGTQVWLSFMSVGLYLVPSYTIMLSWLDGIEWKTLNISQRKDSIGVEIDERWQILCEELCVEYE